MNQLVYAVIHVEAGSYGISFPDFPGCVSGGRSLDEALERGRDTLAFHVQGMVEDCDPLPDLRPLAELKADPHVAGDADGALIVSVPADLPGRAAG